MRKLYLTLLVAIAAMIATPAAAQLKFGVKGGVDVTSLSLNEDIVSKENRTGFYIGPTMKLSLLGLGFDVSALYDQRSANVATDDNVEATIDQKQIAIPINLRYSIGLGSAANIFLFAGPQFGFNVGGDKKVSEYDWKWKDSNFSVNVGFGVTVLSHLQLNANYNIACGKTGEASLTSVTDGVKDFHGRYNAWQVGLAYYF